MATSTETLVAALAEVLGDGCATSPSRSAR